MNDRLIHRIERGADAATRLIIFIVGSAVASWLLFGVLDALVQAVAS